MSGIAAHMLHHISFGVSDIGRAASFYDAVLAPLGYVRVWEDLVTGDADQAVGYGVAGGGDTLAIKLRPDGQCPPGPGFHLALASPNQQGVHDFHRAALQNGGGDNGGRGCAPPMVHIIMLPLSSIRTGTRSRQFSTRPNRLGCPPPTRSSDDPAACDDWPEG